MRDLDGPSVESLNASNAFDYTSIRTGRELRKRNPIQVHPYKLEIEQYRQTLKARGVRPVAVVAESQPDGSTAGSDVEGRSLSGRREDSSPIRAAPITPVHFLEPSKKHPSSTGSSRRSSGVTWLTYDDDELPDLDTLLQNPPIAFTKVGHKRRKTAGYSKTHSIRISHTDQTNKDYEGTNTRSVTSILDIHRSPTSSPKTPPETAFLSSEVRFRVPPPLSPATLLTSANSSVNKNRSRRASAKARRIRDESESEQELPQKPRQAAIILSDENESSDGRSESSHQGSLALIRRRIKGVLPASWLKLDQQAQQKPGLQAQRHDRERFDRDSGRGVAHKRISKAIAAHPELSLVDNPIPLFDDDPGSSGVEREQNSLLPSSPRKKQRLLDVHDNRFHFVRSVDDPGEGMEDNGIDYMLAGASSSRKPSKSTKKRQLRLKDAFSRQRQHPPRPVQEKRNERLLATSTRNLGPRTLKHYQKTISTKSKQTSASNLSILDAIPAAQETPTVPQFLRVAARRVQKRSDQGRHSPTGKQIRLATLQDTEDAAEVLRNWRDGSMLPQQRDQSPSKPARAALGDISANQQRRPPFPVLETKASLQQTRSFGKVVKHIRSNLLPVVERNRHVESAKVIQGQGNLTKENTINTSAKKHLKGRQFRDAQLEASENDFGYAGPVSAFQSHLRRAGAEPTIISFIERLTGMKTDVINSAPVPSHPSRSTDQENGIPSPFRKIQRKLRSRRLDAETREYRQPEPTALPALQSNNQAIEIVDDDKPGLTGLGPYGTHYSKDFDSCPLERGTYFHDSTFVGSGDFERSIFMKHRDLDINLGSHKVYLAGTPYTWSAWSESMAHDLDAIFNGMESILSASPVTISEPELEKLSVLSPTLQEIITSNATWLSFLDPVDRVACVSKYHHYLVNIVDSTLDKIPVLTSGQGRPKATQELLRFLTRQLVLAAQLLSILKQVPTQDDRATDIRQLAVIISRAIVFQLAQGGFSKLNDFVEDNRRHTIREAGIRSDQVEAEAILVVWHVLNCLELPGTSLWTVLSDEIKSTMKEAHDVSQFEKIWQNIFIILPLLEIDSAGVFRSGLRFQLQAHGWTSVKLILERVFELYDKTSLQSGLSINEYIRALLARCHVLMSTWSWKRCDPVINIIFDFFAGNGLAPLRNEAMNGSPKFLEQLHLQPSLEPSPDDKAFHVFLKLVALGLFQMREIYSHKKIRGLVWRWIPNHGRSHRKDETLRQEDLEALRNHHDLLCVLYWASPVAFRPRVDLIQNLVDHSSSHREACRLSVRTWSNLVQFQISTSEPEALLQPFVSWFNDIVEKSFNLFRTARTEAESQFEAANQDGVRLISISLLEKTISRNQQQVLATIADAVNGMKTAIVLASSTERAISLLRNSDTARIFSVFDSKKQRLSHVITETLSLYQAFVDFLDLQRPSQSRSNNSSKDSQDYGDWPELEDNSPTKTPRSMPSIDFVCNPLADLISNVFGAETSPEEGLLVHVVETWTRVAKYQVQHGMKDWTSFLDSYSRHSWVQLRDTEQKRKFTPFFYSSVINCNADILVENREAIFSSWLVSLVERESLLKFQHQLMATLLNVASGDPLLFNMPFTKVASSKTYVISLQELRQRRVSIISTTLSNMQRMFYDAIANSPTMVNARRREYAEYLRQLMSAMKRSYQELGDGDTVRGSYIIFVQAVVEALQQYTADICTVDKFFTDSSAFPLPATDPTYVVGRLKGYTTKLSEPKTVKQLSIFIQNISERAAADRQQPYLVDQLETAMASQRELEDQARPSLRTVLTQAVFPAYISLSLRTTAGWIMGEPILLVCRAMFDKVLMHFSINQTQAVRTVVRSINAVLDALRHSTELLVDHSGLMEQPHIMRMLGLIFNVVTSTLDCLDYILRATGHGKRSAGYIQWFKSFSVFTLQMISDCEDVYAPDLGPDLKESSTVYSEIREFCERELNHELASRWTVQSDSYYLLRGNTRKQLIVELGSVAEERSRLVLAIEQMHTALQRYPCLDMPTFGEQGE